ncbi:MAG: transposase, partial [Thermodesulfobacteriota bacterium]
MIRTRDSRQAPLIDPWGHLGPKRRRLLENSWAGLFRQEILSELPVEQLAPSFRADFGRPAKELHTVLGVLLLQQMHDLTDAETVNQLAFNQQWHFALDIPAESDAAKYMCPKTLWTMRQKVTDLELDALLFQRVTHKLGRVFTVDTTKQRLDSVHLKSNMRRLGRLGILARCIHCFLVKLKRQHPDLYAFLPPGVVERYFTEKALGCFSQVKPSASQKTLAEVAQEGFDLLSRFAQHPQVSALQSYRLLKRAINDHCEVKQPAGDAPAEIAVKPAKAVSSQSLQNPSDPEAAYSSHKGQGYQAQVMETFCDAEDPQVKAKTLNLITHVAVAPASESDSRALQPALEDTQARDLGPQEVLADTAYGSDANCQQAAALGVEVVSPPLALPPSPGLSLSDFLLSPAGRVLACPQGEAPLSCKYRKHRYRVAFSAAKCNTCPEKPRCPVKPAKKYHYLSYYEKAGRVAARRAYQQT